MTYIRLPANLPTILRAAGLKVEEVPGWQTRGRDATHGGFNPRGVLCHHTATGPKTSNAAVVNLLVQGRSDLPGPLCHFGLRRDGTVYIIAAGRANHAGKAKASGNMPAGDGNELYVGIEAFNDGINEPWSAAQMDAYHLLCAVLSLKITHNTVESVRGHKETSVEGKVDPKFDMNAFRKAVDAKMHTTTAPPPHAVMTLRVATNNLMALPINPDVQNAIDASNTIPIVGYQEADPVPFKKAILHKFPSATGTGAMDDVTYAAPIGVDVTRFTYIRRGSRLTHKAAAGISHTRRLTWAVLEDKASKTRFGVINIHGVLVDAKDGNQRDLRLKLRAQDQTALKAQVDALQAMGLPIIITGDFNDTANWLGARYGGRLVQRVQHGIDQILFVNAGANGTWKINSWNHADTSSDHDIVRAQASLLKR